MPISFVRSKQIKRVADSEQPRSKEAVMNCMKLAQTETSAYIRGRNEKVERPRPVLVSSRREYSDVVMQRVAEVVDAELANGSMPA